MTHFPSRSILAVFFLLLGATAYAQDWRQIPLPGQFESIIVAGNPSVPGMLVLATTSSLIIDSSTWDWRGSKKWHFYTSSDAGNSWFAIDSGVFTQPTVVTPDADKEGWTQLLCSSAGVARVMYHTWWEGVRWTCEFRSGTAAFKDIGFPKETAQSGSGYLDSPTSRIGVPSLLVTAGGALLSTRPAANGSSSADRENPKVSMHAYAPALDRWQLLADTAKGMLAIPFGGFWSSDYFYPASSFASPQRLAVLTPAGLFYSSDSSATWRPSSIPSSLIPIDLFGWQQRIPFLIHPADGNIAFGAFGPTPDASKLMRSDDGCDTWRTILSESVWAVAVSPREAGRMVAATGAELLISADLGDTWKYLKKLPFTPPGNRSFDTPAPWIHLDSDGQTMRLFASDGTKLYALDNVTGIDAVPTSAGMTATIAPHPMLQGRSSTLRIACEPLSSYTVSIVDMLGRRCAPVLAGAADNRGFASQILDPRVLRLPSGAYRIIVHAANKTRILPLSVIYY